MKRILLLCPIVLLCGCQLFKGDLSSLPAYASIGRTVLQNELEVDLLSLTDQQLAQRKQIMSTVNPLVAEVQGLGSAYAESIDAEIERRANLLGQ